MSPKNRKKRILKVENQQLRNFRTALRELLYLAQINERKRLRDLSNSLVIDDLSLRLKEEDNIERQIESLSRSFRSAPINCSLCGRLDLDLVYNPNESEWYCEVCYSFNQEHYKKNPHPLEPDWRKLYP